MSVPPDTKFHMEATDSPEDIKRTLRRSLLSLRCSLNDEKRARWDAKISDRIQSHLQTHSLTTLGIYFSTQNEPDLMTLYETLSRKGIILSLPVVIRKTAPLLYAKWKPGDQLVKDNYGISTPETRAYASLPEALLVPCLGFTPDRFRLGYGGGYFDRTLEQEPRPHTIGVAYSCLQTRFPIQEYDIPLDVIITETGAIGK